MSGATTLAAASTSAAERDLRQELAACYRIFDHLGWTELIYNHITVRIPGPEHHFLINPFGLLYEEVNASNLVRIDQDGQVIGPSAYAANPAGFVIHSAIHAAVPEAQCVMHVHTTAGMAVACKAGGLAMTNFYSAMLYEQVSYHAFEGITVDPKEKERLLASLGSNRQLILRNHGLLTWGETIAEAFVRMWTLNRACEIQLASASMQGPDIEVPEDVCRQCTREALQFHPDYGAGRDVFDAMRRLIDARSTDYRN